MSCNKNLNKEKTFFKQCNMDTIILLNKFIDKLITDINIQYDLNYKESLIITENKILIEQIRNNLFEICSHNWVDDEIDSINGLEKITYCEICNTTLNP
jgi:hypothetical protein